MKLSVNISRACYKGVPVLRNISFSLKEKSLVAVIGRNGAGKSTLISAVSDLLAFDGEITVDGRDIRTYKRKELAKLISCVPQITRAPHIPVHELVAYGRSPYLKLGMRLTDSDLEIIEKAMKRAEITHLQDAYADKISGGELRRVWLAMLLSQNTDIALLDEPTAFMDADYENKFMMLARELSREKTVITVTHNLDAAVCYADYILLLDSGEQLFYGSTAELLSGELIERTFGVKRFTFDGKIFFRA